MDKELCDIMETIKGFIDDGKLKMDDLTALQELVTPPQLATIDSRTQVPTTWAPALKIYLDALRQNRTQSTFATYQSGLRRYGLWLGKQFGHIPPGACLWETTIPLTTALATMTIERFKADLSGTQGHSLRPRTIRGHLFPIRGLAKYIDELTLNRRGQSQTDYAWEVGRVSLPTKDDPDNKAASETEISTLLRATHRIADPSRRALAYAIIWVLVGTGLRAAETVSLKLGNVDMNAQTIAVLRGKGGKTRILHPPGEVLKAIKDWLVEREKLCCTHDKLWAVRRSTGISDDYMRKLLWEVRHLGDMGGEEYDHVGPHALRRAFAQRLLARGATVAQIQAALGHTRIETTLEYLRVRDDGGITAQLGAPVPPSNPQPLLQPEPPPKLANRASGGEHRPSTRASLVRHMRRTAS